jgi:hypothetical protein
MFEPPIIPSFTVPGPIDLGVPILELPYANQPSYEPIYLPARIQPGRVKIGTLDEPQETESEEKPTSQLTPPPLRIQIPKSNKQNEETWNDPQIKKNELNVQSQGVRQVNLLGAEVPVPETEILVAAATTATVSVVATLSATWTVKKLAGIMKPVLQQALNRLKKKKNVKVEKLTWARERLAKRQHRRLHKVT